MSDLEAVLHDAFPGCRVVDSTALNGGVSAGAARCTVRLTGGTTREVVVRRPRWQGNVMREHRILTLARAAGIPAPEPLYVDEVGNALVLAFATGAPDFFPRDLEHAMRETADMLAAIHRITPATADLSFLPDRRVTAGAMITERPAALDAALDERGLRAELDRLWPWPQLNASVLLHGDYWPGNVLWHGSRLSTVLDWEESEVGDPLADVALARLDLRWAFGADAAECFTRRYESVTRIDSRFLPHWDLVVALRPMSQLSRWATSYPEPPIARPDIDEASMTAGHREFVKSALARLRA